MIMTRVLTSWPAAQDEAVMVSPEEPSDVLLAVHEQFGSWIEARVRKVFPHEWEDVSQEVMLKLGHAVPAMRESNPEALRAVVSRTVRSVCIDEFRRRGRRRPAAEASDDVPDDATGVATRAARRDDAQRLEEAAWSLLTERERQILKLRFQSGLSFRQISEVLDVPQGSVAGWYSRVMTKLRDAMQ